MATFIFTSYTARCEYLYYNLLYLNINTDTVVITISSLTLLQRSHLLSHKAHSHSHVSSFPVNKQNISPNLGGFSVSCYSQIYMSRLILRCRVFTKYIDILNLYRYLISALIRGKGYVKAIMTLSVFILTTVSFAKIM